MMNEPAPLDAGPTAIRGKHLPALDGVRALAIAAVLAFHLGLLSSAAPRWLVLRGGFLGVDLFFVLSGFLITTLLLEERLSTTRIALGAFWVRRARRLLPALVVMIVGVMVATSLAMSRTGTLGIANLSTPQLRVEGLAALGYVANWFAILAAGNPLRIFVADSPFSHCWSLSIEEQFYLVWPLLTVVVGVIATRRWRSIGLAVTMVLGTASALAMAWSPLSMDIRPWGYFATTSRAWELLLGASLAYLVAGRPQPGPRARRTLAIASPLSLLAMGWFWWNSSPIADGGYHGGFVLYCLLAAILIADVRQVRPSPTAKVLALAPFRGLGRISYGVYLYHWPVFLLLPAFWHLTGAPLNAARLAFTLAISIMSWFLIERPLLSKRIPNVVIVALVPVGVAVAVTALIVGTTPSFVLGPIANHQTANPTRAGAPPAGAGGVTPNAPLNVHHRVTQANPLRVLVLGGEPTYDLLPSLGAVFAAPASVDLTVRAWPTGTGLQAIDLLEAFSVFGAKPDVVVVMPTPDDAAGLLTDPKGASGDIVHRLLSLSAIGSVAGVVVVGYPGWLAPYPAGGTAETAWEATAQRAAAKSSPGHEVRYAPVQGSLSLADGAFPTWLPPLSEPTAPQEKWQRIQMINNIGLCPNGATRYVSALSEDLQMLAGAGSPPSGWWHGSWTMAGSSLGPPSWCPADNPTARWTPPSPTH